MKGSVVMYYLLLDIESMFQDVIATLPKDELISNYELLEKIADFEQLLEEKFQDVSGKSVTEDETEDEKMDREWEEESEAC